MCFESHSVGKDKKKNVSKCFFATQIAQTIRFVVIGGVCRNKK